MRDWETRPHWEEMFDCPFCGARAADYSISVSYGTTLESFEPSNFFGECAECGTCGPLEATEQEAMLAWNSRPTPTTPTVTEGNDAIG